MAETLLSPGVLARENDLSFLEAQPIQAGAAIIGPTVKGPLAPTLVTTYSDYQNRFGTTFISGSDQYTYLTSIAAYNYFSQGGDSLLVARVIPNRGNWTEATSSWIPTQGLYDIVVSSGSAPNTGSIRQFLSVSASLGIGLPYGIVNNAGTFADYTAAAGYTNFVKPAFVLEALSAGVIGNDFQPALNLTKSIFEASSLGALASGSADNLRFEIVSPNTDAGTFSVLIRSGNDNTNSKTILETFANVNLDPKSPNYIARVIGDQKQVIAMDGTQPYIAYSGSFVNKSRYVRVKTVNYKTPDYFDNDGAAKTQYTASIPVACEGVFGGATGNMVAGGTGYYYNQEDPLLVYKQGVQATDYDILVDLLANKDEYRFNVLTVPGITKNHGANFSALVNSVATLAQERGDCLAVLDMAKYGASIVDPSVEAVKLDNSYAATYWPWLQVADPDTGESVWVPASTIIPSVYAFTDKTSEPWFAPAGFNRGALTTVLRAERKLSNADRDALYQNNVNPIATFPNQGVVVFGQKTLQRRASALDRVGVRRLLIELKSYISQVADNLIFEQNTIATRNRFLAQVNPYLETVQQKQGLYAYKVVMDDSNNTADVIDRNQMVGQIYLQPTKTAEYIILDFNVLPTGAVFPS